MCISINSSYWILYVGLQSKTKRCYFYTGQEKDGFFYPLHVATEAGHKNLAILLVRAGADVTAQDYRYDTTFSHK